MNNQQRTQDMTDALKYTFVGLSKRPLNKKIADVCACRSKNLCEFINGKWFCIKCEKEIISAQR